MTTSSFGSPLPRFDFTSTPFLGRRAVAAAAARPTPASPLLIVSVAALGSCFLLN